MAMAVFFHHGGDANHLYHKGLGLLGSAMYLLDINGQEPELTSHPPTPPRTSQRKLLISQPNGDESPPQRQTCPSKPAAELKGSIASEVTTFEKP